MVVVEGEALICAGRGLSALQRRRVFAAFLSASTRLHRAPQIKPTYCTPLRLLVLGFITLTLVGSNITSARESPHSSVSIARPRLTVSHSLSDASSLMLHFQGLIRSIHWSAHTAHCMLKLP